MKKTLLIFFLTAHFPFFIFSAEKPAVHEFGNYIWISYGELKKEDDGGLVMSLEINYGIFPDKKKSVLELENIRVFCRTQKKKKGRSDLIYSELPLEMNNGKCRVQIHSPVQNSFTVMAEAEKKSGENSYFYSAGTSFILFGHSLLENSAVNGKAISRSFKFPLEISLSPRLDYWPQTGSPLSIGVSYGGKPLRNWPIGIYDENFSHLLMRSGAENDCIYIPPNDSKLNWQGKTAFKEIVFVSEKEDGNLKYSASFTRILHRSRYENRKLRAGLIVFAASSVITLALVISKRRKFRI